MVVLKIITSLQQNQRVKIMSNEKINYLELPSKDISKTKQFFSDVFGWEFVDYGPEYCSFSKSTGLDGGFYFSDQHCSTDNGSALVVFYSDDLTKIADKIERHQGKIIKPIFEFPGGRRFHFTDTTGNEYAVWSDK
jgi:predicted enzyme related to lactoylglutathione lyase